MAHPNLAAGAAPRILTNGQRAAAMLACAGMALVGAYGLVISYLTVRTMAEDRSLPLPWLLPLGLEGGLIAVLAMDLVLTWIRRPIAWLRQVARALAAATIIINGAAGIEHGPVAVALHVLAPAILVAGVEALRTHLLRLVADADEMRRQPIPRMRWILAPLSTVAMWRRMVLWQETSYAAALDADLDRRESVHLLRRAHGPRWRRAIPADMAYRLAAGVRVAEAVAWVRATQHQTAAHASAPALAEPSQPTPLADEIAVWLGQDPPDGGHVAAPPTERPDGGRDGAAAGLPSPGGEQMDSPPDLDMHGLSEQTPDESSERVLPLGEQRRLAGLATMYRVAEHRAAHPDASTQDIADALGLAPSTVRRHLRVLEQMR